MTWLHIVYWIGCAIGILMFGASWLIRRRKITEGPVARADNGRFWPELSRWPRGARHADARPARTLGRNLKPAKTTPLPFSAEAVE